jgi:hypothetical protein
MCPRTVLYWWNSVKLCGDQQGGWGHLPAFVISHRRYTAIALAVSRSLRR